jgi:predicted PurR-regulated permease PerM
MEFFLPGVLIFLSAIAVTYLIVPHFTPIVTMICSIIFLTFGVYHHQQMFATEYRLSTWQEGLKIYAPAIMIVAICLFIIYSIIAFFTGVQVPIPTIPAIEMPQVNTITNSLMNVYNNAEDAIENVKNDVSNSIDKITNNVTNKPNNKPNNKNKPPGNNGLTRSALEVI